MARQNSANVRLTLDLGPFAKTNVPMVMANIDPINVGNEYVLILVYVRKNRAAPLRRYDLEQILTLYLPFPRSRPTGI